MGNLFRLFLLFGSFSFWCSQVLGSISTEFVFPNFSASNLQFVDQSGVFLTSRNSTFQLGIFSFESSDFYLSVVHAASRTVIWSANRESPISDTGKLIFSSNGLVISDQNGVFKWRTPLLSAAVHAMQLTEMGNLVLLDKSNGTLWESFSHPTDVIVVGQKIPVGSFLSSSVSSKNFATGSYRLVVTSSETFLQWNEFTYWKLSMGPKAYVNSNYNVDYLTVNASGLFLLAQNGSATVLKIVLPPAKFRAARLTPSGQFEISSYSGADESLEVAEPQDTCRIPYVCGQLGLCSDTSSGNPTCSCPQGFINDDKIPDACVPVNASLTSGCHSDAVTYISLGNSLDYFATDFSPFVTYGVSRPACEDSCTANCSCLGYFYDDASGKCYAIKDHLSSIISRTSGADRLAGYVKATLQTVDREGSNHKGGFPMFAVVLLPFIGLSVAFVACFLWCKRRNAITRQVKLGEALSFSSDDWDAFYIPGLPKRYEYSELQTATENFKIKIGSGGFGSVYIGTLPDKSLIAVKKLTNLGVQGNKEFCTEIAVIGKIHHMNLVKLRGFCAQGRERLLVYEYMNRGSLEKTLFGMGPVLEWQERMDIALGTARGLAYLHNGCEEKVIHCDVKPENILLHDQFQAKISDFGLSKLLSPEQSSLFTTMRGTRGYLAPEWLTNSAISEKTDVYSFGMVLLEIVSGRKNCSTRSQNPSRLDSGSNVGESSSSMGSRMVYFPLMALEMHEQGRYVELADGRLEGRVTADEVERVVRIALCCVHEDPSLRPSMASVAGMLEGSVGAAAPRVESLNFLRFYGQRFVEASMADENSVPPVMEGSPSETSSTRESQFLFSYMSSQQVSGPR